MEELRAEFKASQRAAYELGKKNEELSVKMTAQFELMQKNVVDLLAEVKSEAESEAASTGNREHEKRSELLQNSRRSTHKKLKHLRVWSEMRQQLVLGSKAQWPICLKILPRQRLLKLKAKLRSFVLLPPKTRRW
jgi:vacuolar-type H+-ATPase subunit E/Vma4